MQESYIKKYYTNKESLSNFLIMSLFKFLILENLYFGLLFGMLDDVFERVLDYVGCWLKGSFFAAFDMIHPITLQIGKIPLDNLSFGHSLHFFAFNLHLRLLLPNPALILNLLARHRKFPPKLLMFIERKLKLI